MPVFDDFGQMSALLGIEGNQKEVVEDEELRFFEFLQLRLDCPFVLAIFRVPISLEAFAYRTRMPALQAS